MASVEVNHRTWDRTFAEYVKTSKRSLSEVTWKAAFEVAKLSTVKTKFVPRDQIKAKLHLPSRISPTMTIAEVISNRIRVSNGLPALTRNKLRIAGNKYESKAARSSKFLISGALPMIAKLAPLVKKSAGAGQKGAPKGGAIPAPANIQNYEAVTTIFNSVLGGIKKWYGAPVRNINKVQAIIRDGLQLAMQAKEADMKVYLERKANEAAAKFNKG